MDWAKHRRQKVAAKAHVSLSLGNLLPIFVVREKTSFKYKVLRKRKPGQERILSDEEIRA